MFHFAPLTRSLHTLIGIRLAIQVTYMATLEFRYQPPPAPKPSWSNPLPTPNGALPVFPRSKPAFTPWAASNSPVQFEHEDPAVRSALLDAKTFLVYQKQFNNLTVQETRLRRQRDKDLAELKQLQAEREAARKRRFHAGLKAFYRARFHKRGFDFSTIGFEFTADDFIQ